MDLRSALRRRLVNRPATLLVCLPGATRLRLEAAAELRYRGWPSASGPADADLLLVCAGPGGTGGEWLENVRGAMPWPAARTILHASGQAARALDEGARKVAAEAGTVPAATEARPGTGDGPPMAGRGDDRDGLRLDQLHLPLGPALPDWPAGLILRLTLQGDLVQEAHPECVDAGTHPHIPFWDEPWLRAARGEMVPRGAAARRRCAAHLDSVGRLLAVTGWDGPAARARRIRDGLLASPAGGGAVPGDELRRLVNRLERSRTLRRMTEGLGELPARRARALGVSGPALVADGDTYDRLCVWLHEIRRSHRALAAPGLLEPGDTGGPRGTVGDGILPPSRALLGALPELLAGRTFDAARTVLAGLDPDIDQLLAAPAQSAGAADA